MPVPIRIPDIGAAEDEVTLVQWLVEEGEEIARGQKIVAIETDKAVVELESVAAGTLLKQCAAEGADATTGDIIAYVGDPGESVPQPSDSGPGASESGGGPETSESQAGIRPAATPQQALPTDNTEPVSQPRVSPMVRNLARQKGVDLEEVTGTGAGGVITRKDILAAAKNAGSNG